jgi:DNA-binding transcriptional MerR regulator
VSDQWALVNDAARLVRVRPGTIRVWATRGKVRAEVRGAHRYVHLGDVRRAEKAWRERLAPRITSV